jgi:hypothetical protein
MKSVWAAAAEGAQLDLDDRAASRAQGKEVNEDDQRDITPNANVTTNEREEQERTALEASIKMSTRVIRRPEIKAFSEYNYRRRANAFREARMNASSCLGMLADNANEADVRLWQQRSVTGRSGLPASVSLALFPPEMLISLLSRRLSTRSQALLQSCAFALHGA